MFLSASLDQDWKFSATMTHLVIKKFNFSVKQSAAKAMDPSKRSYGLVQKCESSMNLQQRFVGSVFLQAVFPKSNRQIDTAE